MRYAKSNYPIGATWKCVVNSKIGTIEFNRMQGNIEVWLWGVQYDDGSGHKGDWTTSYNSAKRQIPLHGRFKRIK